jgi:hypothetical protein
MEDINNKEDFAKLVKEQASVLEMTPGKSERHQPQKYILLR